MDILSIAGIGLGIFILYFGISSGGGVETFLNPNAFLIVLGGTFASIMIGTPIRHVMGAIREVCTLFFSREKHSPADIVLLMINLSRKAHKYGLASIRSEGKKLRIKFLDRAIRIASSGMQNETIRKVLEKEIIETREHQKEAANIFRTMGMFAPMFGLVGTVVGIIKLLGHLTQIETIGPSMALAITTTFYGIFFANLVFIPISSKLRLKSQEQTIIKEMIMEGILSIKAGEIPYVIKSHLQAFVDKNIEVKKGR